MRMARSTSKAASAMAGVVPERSILVGEEHERPIRREPGADPRKVQAHQGQQPERLRLVRHEADEERGQPFGVGGELASFGHRSVRGEVALVEDEVEDCEHLLQALRQLGPVGDAERDAGVPDLALGAHQPLGDRRLGDEERAGHLRGVEAADGAQRERHLRLAGEGGMAAGEDEAQPVVRGERAAGGDRSLHLVSLLSELRQAVAEPCVASQPVDRPTARRGHQPGAGVAWQAVRGPVLERRDGRLLDQLLGQVPVAQDAHQRRDQASPLLAEDPLQRCVDRVALRQARRYPISPVTSGRISRVSGAGHEEASRIAASRSGTSMTP